MLSVSIPWNIYPQQASLLAYHWPFLIKFCLKLGRSKSKSLENGFYYQLKICRLFFGYQAKIKRLPLFHIYSIKKIEPSFF
jgi:hypothetical protein|tara:strand:- start:1313 stop:1555 length:243 start_codon:yes stop_codon:yes gene_type:complete